ncbi:MAG: 4Fe-4S dicluster domain-containing protein [Chitinispirillaceae bacterium]|nr:4Fe-4S dicluster domain-containing protein [Chitinispirillaceae bacterium]
MKKVDGCIHCNQCKSPCPYELDTPARLMENRIDYKKFT